MGAFNHRYRIVADAPEPKLHQWGDGTFANFYNHACTAQKCHGQPIAAQIAYDYVTGRAGRITSMEKFVCQKHLDAFLKKNPTAIKCPDTNYEHARRYSTFREITSCKT